MRAPEIQDQHAVDEDEDVVGASDLQDQARDGVVGEVGAQLVGEVVVMRLTGEIGR